MCQDSVDADLQTARLCFADIEAIFKELEETRPFEVLRSGSDRGNYLLTKHAKVWSTRRVQRGWMPYATRNEIWTDSICGSMLL